MDAAQRNRIIRGWDHLENEQIVKEVATKGKYISLALGLLQERLGTSLDGAKEFFNNEVNAYVYRLLGNRQVYKAEHVLKNIGREPKFVFFEFSKLTEMDTIREPIEEHLKKLIRNFDMEFEELDVNLELLKLCQSNAVLKSKYKDELKSFSLEMLYKKESQFRNMFLVDVYLTVKPDLDLKFMDKHYVWKYFLERKMLTEIAQWLETLHQINRGTYRPKIIRCFQNKLENQFALWTLDESMIEIVQNPDYKLSDPVLFSLARHGIFADVDQKNVRKMLHRICTSESWSQNRELFETKGFQEKVIRAALESNLTSTLCEEFISTDVLKDIDTEFPILFPEIQLSLKLKPLNVENAKDFSEAISHVTDYFRRSNPNFNSENHFVFLMELLMNDTSITTILENDTIRDDLNKIPFLKSLLNRLESESVSNSQEVNVYELIKQTKKIDLRQIKQEFETGDLSFGNLNLIEKYSNPTKLDYIHYIKQCRSSFAVYTFLLDQLRTYSLISNRQILLACSTAAELAVKNFDDYELVTHSMAFIEMLCVDSATIRAYIKCLSLAKLHCPDLPLQQLQNDIEIFDIVKSAIRMAWIDGQFNPRHMEALTMVYKARGMPLPNEFLKDIANHSDWFQLLLFASYFGYSIQQLIDVCERSFGEREIGRNLARAIQCDEPQNVRCRRNSSLSYRERKKQIQNRIEMNSATSGETMSSSISSNDTANTSKLDSTKYFTTKDTIDLYAIILQSTCESTVDSDMIPFNFEQFLNFLQNPSTFQASTELNLLRNAIEKKWSILAVLAATVRPELKVYCWLVWLMKSVNYIFTIEYAETMSDLSRNLIEYCVQNNYTRTLHQSIKIFYPNSNIKLFTEYLFRIGEYEFTVEVAELFKTYLLALNRDEQLFECLNGDKTELLNFSVNILIIHLNVGFDSINHNIQILQSLCETGISDFVINIIDLATIRSVLTIASSTTISVNYDMLMRNKYSDSDIRLEYESLCDQLIGIKEFPKAMEIADLLNFPKDSMVYEFWMYNYDMDENFNLNQCELDAERQGMLPELVISFYINVADKLSYVNPKKYTILKKTLDVIKKNHLFPNESFDRDRIEYEMVLCFLKSTQPIEDLDIYNSEYFECIMLAERFVLFKTFMELKEMAGIDELTVSNKNLLDEQEMIRLEVLINRLLDQGDIVEALRVQAIFNHRPIDLHYIVFCMALAEGLATLYDLSLEQRQMLSDGVKTGISRFTRRTLRKNRLSQTSAASSPTKTGGHCDSSDTSANFEFEEIPSRDKQDILEALQSLAAKVKHGSKISQRIAMTWRAALYLDKEYADVLKTKDPLLLLQNAIDEDCLNKLIVMSDIMISMEMTQQEVALFLANQIASSIIKSRFYILQNQLYPMSVSQNSLWGFDLDKEFRMFLELCPNTSMLGNNLLKYCDALKLYRKYDLNKNAEPDVQDCSEITELYLKLRDVMENRMLSHKKQNTISVELLIKAHDCYVHECNMEGIATILQRTKVLNSVLANAKSWNLIVKMLIGIGRYRDMYYCFETLIANDQFESLLGQFDEDRTNGLKQAIISYLHEHCPANTEFYRLAALHFMMYKEIAEMWKSEANGSITKLIIENEVKSDEVDKNLDVPQYLKCTVEIVSSLNTAMEGYVHATENYLLENKLALAQETANRAELVALQINLMNCQLENGNGNHCICVINVRSAGVLRYIVNNELNVPQSIILGRACPYEINWIDAIYNQYVLNGNEVFLNQFCQRMELTECMIEALVKNFQHETNITSEMEKYISSLVELVQSVTLRYKLASLLGLKKIVARLINEHSSYYLKDTNYGRTESTL